MLTATRPATGTCEICQRPFPIRPQSNWQRYCGPDCKGIAYYRRRRGLLPPNPPRGKSYDEVIAECEAVDAARVPPVEPTTAKPGSGSKVAVLAARVADGLTLWHPSDAGFV